MTIAIGITCPEGAMLLTDSMVLEIHEDGSIPRPGRRKSHSLNAARVGVVSSGPQFTTLEELCDSRYENDFDLAVSALFDDLLVSHAEAIGTLSPSRRAAVKNPAMAEPVLLAVGGPPSSRPRMALLTPDGQRWSDESAIFAIGCWLESFIVPRGILSTQPPSTLDGCRQLALDLAREFIESIYEGKDLWTLLIEGRVPGVAFPLYLTTFTSTTATTEEIQA